EPHREELAHERLVESRPHALRAVGNAPSIRMPAVRIAGPSVRPRPRQAQPAVHDQIVAVGPVPRPHVLALRMRELIQDLRHLGDMGVAVEGRVLLLEAGHSAMLTRSLDLGDLWYRAPMRFTFAEAMCDPKQLLPLAIAAEEAGYDSVSIADSICYPA